MAAKTYKFLRHKKKNAFLAAYALCGNITKAAECATIPRMTHYDWLKSDEAYAAAFEEAKQEACDHLEAEARRRAVEGTEKPVFYKGEECGTIREYSDTLLMFLMKGAMPEKYKDRVQSEITGQGGGPIVFAWEGDAGDG